jgi:hypothetical protein
VSYELIFWQQDGSRALDPADAYQELMARAGTVQGLTEIPVDAFLEELAAAFLGAAREVNGSGEWLVWVGNKQQAVLEVTWSRQHVRADCLGLSGDDMNRVVDVAIGIGCPLYDPQSGERFAFDGR